MIINLTAEQLWTLWDPSNSLDFYTVHGYRTVTSVEKKNGRIIITTDDGGFARKWPSSPVRIRVESREQHDVLLPHKK